MPDDSPDAGNTQNDFGNYQTKMIPLDKIIPNPIFNKCIRSKGEFKDLVEDMNLHGQNQPVVVRPSKNKTGFYELGIGHHRFWAAQELGWKEIRAEIRNIVDDLQWAEIIVTDNLRRTNYSQIQLEEQTYLLWNEGKKSGRYENYKDLGKVLRCSGTWIKNRFEARELRLQVINKYPEVALDNITTQSMLDAKKIMENSGENGLKDYARLLEIANSKGYKSKMIKEMAENLPAWPEELKKKVLYDGASYGEIKFQLRNQADGSKRNPTKKAPSGDVIESIKPKFVIDVYEDLNKHLHNYLTTLEGKEKYKTIGYLKATIALICEELVNHNRITEVHNRQIADDILEFYITPYNYKGDSNTKPLGGFTGNTHASRKEDNLGKKDKTDKREDKSSPINEGGLED